MAGAMVTILGHDVRLDVHASNMSSGLTTTRLLSHDKQTLAGLNCFYLEILLDAAKLNSMNLATSKF